MMPYDQSNLSVEAFKPGDLSITNLTADSMGAANRRFKTNPRQTIQWVRDGSFVDLGAAMCYGGPHYRAIPSDLHIPLFEAILANLENFKRFNAPGSKIFRRSSHDHVWTLLFALSHCDETFMQHNDVVVELILKSWPMIIKWLHILTKGSNDDNVMIFFDKESRSEGLVLLLVKLASTSRTSDILQEDEVIAFAFDYWSRSDLDLRGRSHASFLLSQCVVGVEKNLPRLLDISKWDLDQIMELILSRLRYAAAYVAEEPHLVEYFVAFLQIISAENYGPVSDLCLSLDANGVLLYIVKSSFKYWKKMTGSGLEDQRHLVKECLVTVNNILKGLTGAECIEAVKMVLRNGYLEFILSSSIYVKESDSNDEHLDYPRIFLYIYFPRFLVYPSCIRTCLYAIQRLSTTALKAIAKGHPSYQHAWRCLQQVLSHRIASAAYLRVNRPFYRCSNLSCRTIASRRSFRKCGGCEERFFCSRECQRVAWKTQGHRTLCEGIACETDVHRELTVIDYEHLTLVAKAEIARQLPYLRRIAAVEFSGVDFNDICFGMNFMTSPPTVNLETLDIVKKEAYKGVFVDFIQRVGSHDRSRVVLLRIDAIMDMWPVYVQSVYRLVEIDKTGSANAQLTAVLEAGKASGGKGRESCFLKSAEQPQMEAEYDIIDEIVRRASKRVNDQPLLCDFKFADIIQEEAELIMDELGTSLKDVIYI